MNEPDHITTPNGPHHRQGYRMVKYGTHSPSNGPKLKPCIVCQAIIDRQAEDIADYDRKYEQLSFRHIAQTRTVEALRRLAKRQDEEIMRLKQQLAVARQSAAEVA